MEIDTSENGTEPAVSIDTLDEGAVTLEMMNETPTLIGTSGKRYRGISLLTELSTRQKNYLRDCLVPIYPLAVEIIKKGLDAFQSKTDAQLNFSNEDILAAMRSVRLSEAFTALFVDDMALQLLAGLYLPEDARTFHVETVAARMEDLQDIQTAEMMDAFKRWFFLNWSSSQASTLGFLIDLMRKRTMMKTNGQASSNPGVISP